MRIQLIEVQYLSMIITIPFLFGFALKANLVGLIISIVFLLFLSCVFPLVVKYQSERKYGAGIIHNRVFGIIEFHINRTKDWSQIAKRVAKTRRIAKELNMEVLFYTDHYDESRMRKLEVALKVQLDIKPANLFQRAVYKFTSAFATLGINRESYHPVLRCVMKTRNLCKK